MDTTQPTQQPEIQRIDIQHLEPKAYQAMFGLDSYLAESELEPSLRELIKVRASQINGCAYCIQLHTEHARQHGESEQRLYALAAWVESPLFNTKERIVLALTDDVTCLAVGGVSDDTYYAALDVLGENCLAQVLMQIATINAWNRMAVATRMQHV